MQVVCVYLCGRGGNGGVGVKIRLPIGLYLETFLERDVTLRLLSSSLTLQSQVIICVFDEEICSH